MAVLGRFRTDTKELLDGGNFILQRVTPSGRVMEVDDLDWGVEFTPGVQIGSHHLICGCYLSGWTGDNVAGAQVNACALVQVYEESSPGIGPRIFWEGIVDVT